MSPLCPKRGGAVSRHSSAIAEAGLRNLGVHTVCGNRKHAPTCYFSRVQPSAQHPRRSTPY